MPPETTFPIAPQENERQDEPAEPESRVRELRSAVDGAVQQLRAATFTLVSVALYLFVMGLGTSDRDLLLGRHVKLPIFDVDVELLPFYVLAPAVLLVLHVTVLNLCRLVARRLLGLQQELADKDPLDREFVLGLLYPDPLIERSLQHPVAWYVRAILSLSIYTPIMVMPVLTLLWLELRFFPYQSHWITGWHIALVVVDVALIWVMWREVMQMPKNAASRRDDGRHPGRHWGLLGHGAAVLAVGASVALVFAADLFKEYPKLGWAPWLDVQGEDISQRGSAESATGFPTITESELQARLKALTEYNKQAPDHFTSMVATGALRAGGVHLRGRNLRKANLMGAALAGADLTDADLTGADLRYVDLRGAILTRATLDKARLDNAQLETADLTDATAVGADLPFAELQGAILHNTDFTGADLQGAHLQFVRFKDPMPTPDKIANHSEMLPPKFGGAILNGAQLQGMPLEHGYNNERSIDVRGADLRLAHLEGVNLRLFILSGANLSEYSSLPQDQQSRSLVCGNNLLLATCQSDQDLLRKPDDPINFSQLCYDAARILTVETWKDIAETLQYLVGDPTQCLAGLEQLTTTAGLDPARFDSSCTSNEQIPHVVRNCAASDLDSYLVHLLRTVKDSPDWCSNSERPHNGLCLRGVTFVVYDALCQPYRERPANYLDAAEYTKLRRQLQRYEDEARAIFKAASIEAPQFKSQYCVGPTPKEIPQVAQQTGSPDGTKTASLVPATLSNLLAFAGLR
jgi:uncharacterized protein YjbI with pentapeptide repeats